MTKIKSEDEMREDFKNWFHQGHGNEDVIPNYWLNIIAEREREVQQDINSVLAMVQGETDRKQIANFIKKYLISK